MFHFKINKHDRYLLELYDQIKDEYDSLSTNVELKNKKRSVAEIDILAKKGNEYDIYEVKCSYRITKARRQMKKIQKHLKFKIANKYFYCGATSGLILIL
ncbi:hypothetical protein HOD20_00200 [archaeon]|nr:hypothetical protein [archaeon]MBT4350922.1 hypothetical protein [archaeon]MBT4646946.1 hypothetical protein [archaeon]MBT6821688.1 hypothetical protein [archaeon]MBT7392219.1 hypothetical protein [archaeon]